MVRQIPTSSTANCCEQSLVEGIKTVNQKSAVCCVMLCRGLHGVDIDKAKREVYMPIAGIDPATGMAVPPEALLLVDFDNSNVGECGMQAASSSTWQSLPVIA
jgi:hypothetical protein